MLVEKDDAGAESNPDTANNISTHHPQPCKAGYSRHINSGVEGRLGRFGLLSGGVDGGQGSFRARDLAGGSCFLSFGAHGETARLFRQKPFEIERLRP